MKRAATTAAVLCATFLAAGGACAQTATWTGLGPGTDWSTAANWTAPPAAPPAAFDRVLFDTPTNLLSTVDAPYAGNRLDFGPNAGTLLDAFTVNGTNLALAGGITTEAAVAPILDLPVTFSNPGGFADVDNGSAGSSPGLRFEREVVLSDTTLGVNNLRYGSVPNFEVIFREGISGNGSVQVGTRPFVTGTRATLYGDNAFSGDLRVRNIAEVLNRGGTNPASGQLSQVQGIFIESPVDFVFNQGRVSIGGGSPTPPATNKINDTANLVLASGYLEILHLDGLMTNMIVENVGDAFFNFGHSSMGIGVLSPTYGVILETTAWNRSSEGATLTLRGQDTSAIPITTPPPFIGPSNFRTSGSGPTNVGGGTGPTQFAIVPWIIGEGGGTDRRGTTFVRYEDSLAVTNRRFISLADTNYLGDFALATAADNMSVSNSIALPSGPTNLPINALRIVENSAPLGLDLNGRNLQIGSGALLVNTASSVEITNGSLDFGPAQGVIFNETTTTIGAAILGGSGLVVSGFGDYLRLAGDNTFTGPVWLNQTVQVGSDSAFGDAANQVNLNQDTGLDFIGSAVVSNNLIVRGSGVEFYVFNGTAQLEGGIHTELPVAGETASTYFTAEGPSDGAGTLLVGGVLTSEGPTDLVLVADADDDRIAINGTIAAPASGQTRVFSSGLGRKELNADNSYNGPTRHASGTLRLANPDLLTGSATGTGAFVAETESIGSDIAVVEGEARIAGNATFIGAAINPGFSDGDATGQIVFGGNLSFQTGGGPNFYVPEARFDLASPTDLDQLLVPAGSTVALDNSVRLSINMLAPVTVGDTFRIVDAPGAFTITGLFLDPNNGDTPLANMAVFSVPSLIGASGFQILYGPDYVELSAVPEPPSVALLALAGAYLVARRLRHRTRRAP